MKKIVNHKIFTVLGFTVILVSSCKKNEYLNVNKNPNGPESVSVNNILPASEANVAYTMGNQLALVGGFWAQYWTQGPNANQYAQIDQYVYGSTDADRPWAELYKAAENLDIITKNADSTQSNYAAIAYFMEAYTFQVLTDGWGRIPFSEALLGSVKVSPKYDNESVVYDSLIIMINKGLALVNSAKTTPTEDIIYEGDMSKWIKFANTLKLKIYIRQSAIRPNVTSAGIAALSASSAAFLGDGDDADVSYADVKYQQNPLYATGVFLQATNLTASKTSIDYLYNLAITDMRMLDFYDPAPSLGDFYGIVQGQGKLLGGAQNDGNFSHPSATEIVGPTSKVKLMTSPESQFLQAEAVVNGWMTGDDKMLYNGGITSSWNSWANSRDSAAIYLNAYLNQDSVNYDYATTAHDKIRLIHIQKWAAMNGNQNFESWTEWRRTMIPDFFPVSATSVIGNKFPRRITYPSNEVTSNTNFPGLEVSTKPVWWDLH